MVTRNPGQEKCGTKHSGWLASPVPHRGDPPTQGLVCFTKTNTPDVYSNGACKYGNSFYTNIHVCACSYDEGSTLQYLYKLPVATSGGLDAAYCGSDDVQSPAPSPPPPSSPVVLPPHPPAAPNGYCDSSCPQSLDQATSLHEAWRNVSAHSVACKWACT